MEQQWFAFLYLFVGKSYPIITFNDRSLCCPITDTIHYVISLIGSATMLDTTEPKLYLVIIANNDSELV